MPEPTRVRSFIAVDLEPAVRTAIAQLQAELASCGADVRWVRAHGLHATLKFLGAVQTTQLEVVRKAVEGAVSEHAPHRLRVVGVGAFPSLRRARVLWVGLASPALGALAAAVEAAVVPLGFPPERRPFAPHVTLGRVRSPRGWARLEPMLQTHREDDFGSSEVRGVTIYRSTLHRDGAVYAPLWTIPLRRNKEGAVS
jgi:2'-5' RNA ligase